MTDAQVLGRTYLYINGDLIFPWITTDEVIDSLLTACSFQTRDPLITYVGVQNIDLYLPNGLSFQFLATVVFQDRQIYYTYSNAAAADYYFVYNYILEFNQDVLPIQDSSGFIIVESIGEGLSMEGGGIAYDSN